MPRKLDVYIAVGLLAALFLFLISLGGCASSLPANKQITAPSSSSSSSSPLQTYASESGCTYELLDVRTVEVEPTDLDATAGQ